MHPIDLYKFERDARRALFSAGYDGGDVERILDWFRRSSASDESHLLGEARYSALLGVLGVLDGVSLRPGGADGSHRGEIGDIEYHGQMARLFVYAPLILRL